MPRPYIGKTVLWKPCPNAPTLDCAAGIVTRVSGDGKTVSLSTFPPDSRVIATKDAVRHESDPEWQKFGNQDAGVWADTGPASVASAAEEIDDTV